MQQLLKRKLATQTSAVLLHTSSPLESCLATPAGRCEGDGFYRQIAGWSSHTAHTCRERHVEPSETFRMKSTWLSLTF